MVKGVGTISNVSNSYKYVDVDYGVTFTDNPAVSCYFVGACANRFINIANNSHTGVRVYGYCTSGTADIEFGWMAIGYKS